MASTSAALVVFRLPLRRPAGRFSTRLQRSGMSGQVRFRAELSPQEEPEPPLKPSDLGVPTSTLRAGLGALGFLEAAYLTYVKFTGAEAFCPVGGGSCGGVLNSDYSFIFGLPLPLLGMLAYGSVALLSLQQSGKNLISGLGENDTRFILLVTTTSMATASAYFLYILSTKFAGTTCSYCLLSALLSFSLFFITLKDIGFEEVRNGIGLQLAIAGVVVVALTNTYSMADTQQPVLSDITLEPYETEITNQSTPLALSLAKHLRSIGAKMYGAFWCSHCNEQKQMFGSEATKVLDYVECFPNGAGKGRTMASECSSVGIQGFPTWVIKGKLSLQILSGEQDLQTLAEASEFVADETFV
ncbi:thiol-disulfide oxidoreductase LTO1-like isoform X2 [Zingiber officinale]|uniref:thiol-disulfide oxidoreductase LTO1-like isoform X2 n=1 Tax=Zingiber officinale TaxID=94328 RepID=UPI001C4DB2D8|nr:thiol-disulfide oxidoreductase LTO1-like isoform X2 [Zingiber officinale]